MKMLISELSQETVEELCSALEKGLTLGWKVLMKKWFRTLYSEDDVAIIESNKDPAKVLLDDLTLREITLQELLNGLESIGNNKAVSIIMKGTQKSGLDMHYSGRRPPPQVPQFSAAFPQEHKDFSFSCTQPIQHREQADTLKHPVQETVAREGHSSDPGLETPLHLGTTVVSKIFSCFSF